MDIFSKEIAFGLTPFETIYFESKVPHFTGEHFKRLKRASGVLGVPFNHGFKAFSEEIEFFLLNQNCGSGVLKVIPLNGDLHFNIRQPAYSREKYEEGFKLTISKALRDEKKIINYFKTFNYGTNFIEDNRAKDKGFDGALFLNSREQISETSYANIFFRKGTKLYTPNLSCGILRGIMRDKVLGFARGNGFLVEKCYIGIGDIKNYEECFITNSVAGVFPVAEINGIFFQENDFCRLISREAYFKRDWN